MAWKVEYYATQVWDGTINYGASLKAYEQLGAKYGYRLVGCSLSGVNAFFVQDRLCQDFFQAPYTAEHHYQPARYFLLGKRVHSPAHRFSHKAQ